MANLTGSSTAEIEAPLERVWVLVEDVVAAPQWQGGLKSLCPLERDGKGRATRCETATDIKVRTVKTIVHFAYVGPTRLSWTQEKATSSRSTAAGSSRISATAARVPPTRSRSTSAACSERSFAARSWA